MRRAIQPWEFVIVVVAGWVNRREQAVIDYLIEENHILLIAIELSTRRIQIAGITPQPDSAFMMQVGRNLTDPFDGFLLGKRFLIMDRDPKYTKEFRELLGGVLRYYYRQAA